jgi:hypothetical protein
MDQAAMVAAEGVDWAVVAFMAAIVGLVWVWLRACTSAHDTDGE